MAIDCATAREQIDAAALGALDAEEAQALDEHVATCTGCAAELAEAREAAASLGLAAPLVSARPGLKARVMGSAAVLSDIDGPRRPRGPRRWSFALGAAAVIVAGVAIWNVVLQQRISDVDGRNDELRAAATAQSSELASMRESLDTQQALTDIIAQPDTRSVQLVASEAVRDASAAYLWSPSERIGALVARSLPPAPEGMTYRLWVVEGKQWTAAGDFSVDEQGSGRLVVRTSELDEAGNEPAAGDDWYCVTLEPRDTQGRMGDILLTSAP